MNLSAGEEKRISRFYEGPALRLGPWQKGFAVLEAARLPNLFTAPADVIAGSLASGWGLHLGSLLLLCASSVCLCASGGVINDIVDRAQDAKHRPLRPIPSGRLSVKTARFLALALSGFGLLFSAIAGIIPLAISSSLLGLILFYNLFAKKREFAGPIAMGVCRAANILLGMSPALGGIDSWHWAIPAIMFFYVFAIARLGRFEAFGIREKALVYPFWLLSVCSLMFITGLNLLNRESLFFQALFAGLSGYGVTMAFFPATGEAVRRGVKIMVLSIPLLDASIAAGLKGTGYGLAVSLLMIPPLILSKRIKAS